jgi:phosphate transport system protein
MIHFHREIEKLKKRLLDMGALVETAMEQAIESLLTRDRAKAQAVIDGDVWVDAMEVEIDEESLKILALYQPVAEDLRVLAAAMHINAELEGVGDQAVNIAERAVFLAEHDPVAIPPQVRATGRAAVKMVRASLDSFVSWDAEAAEKIRDMDDEVDDGYRQIIHHIYGMMRDDPDRIPQAMHLFSVGTYLERVGDLATDISEEVVYIVRGESIRHRKKLARLRELEKVKADAQGEPRPGE